MANEINTVSTAGLTLYAVITNASNYYWYTSAFEAYNASHWTSYAVTMTETGTTGRYVGTFPTGITTAGRYVVEIRSRASTSAAVTDPVVAMGFVDWSGGQEVTLATNGPGAYLCTWTVNDGSTVLENAIVRFSEGANSYTATTNASGIATMSLDAATYTVSITKDGYSFTPTTQVVSSTGSTHSHTFSMSAITITPPALPSQSTGTLTTLDEQGNAEAGVSITFQLTAGPGDDGYRHNTAEFTLTSNGSGALSGSFTRLATYNAWSPKGTLATFTVPDATSFTLPEILGGAA